MSSAPAISRRIFTASALAAVFAPLDAQSQTGARSDGFRVLEASPGGLRLLPGPAPETAIWGYDGGVPGPILRFAKGEEVKVRLVNRLDQPTTLSWHGVRIANAMDGVASLTQAAAPPGGSFEYRFTPLDSGLYWYHPHALPFNSEQLGRGLCGALIIGEPDPPKADRDILLMIQDWKLDEAGQIAADFAAPTDAGGSGRIGGLVTVNAAPAPVAEMFPPRARLRLRILSAVNARIMLLSFLGATPLILAIDGQPCAAFEPVRRTIPLGPGARFDVMMDLPAEPGAEAKLVLLGDKEPDRELFAFKTQGAPRDPLPPIASLPQNPLLPTAIKLQNSRKIDLVIEAAAQPAPALAPQAAAPPLYWKLNGLAQGGFAAKPLFSVRRGSAVTLALVNRAAVVLPIHIHGHDMRLLHDLDDGWEPYWRDAVLVPAGKTKHVAFIADNPGKWAIESLIAEHQDAGLATWFEVT